MSTLTPPYHSCKSSNGDFTSAPSDESGRETDSGREADVEGHVYDLAVQLQEQRTAREEAEQARRRARRWTLEKSQKEFPEEVWRLPIPNEVFRALPGLKGAGARTLLLMIRSTFRYDPENGWIHDGTRTRADLENVVRESGLSPRSIQKGIKELAAAGFVEIDDRGRSHVYRLLLRPPDSGYTWLPTSVIDRMGELSAPELRLLLTVYRATWGWTAYQTRGHSRDEVLVHDRFAQLSNADLKRRTGLSRTSVIKAACALCERGWIERDRLDNSEAFFFSPVRDAHREESEPPTSLGKEKNFKPARGTPNPKGASPTSRRGPCSHRKQEGKRPPHSAKSSSGETVAAEPGAAGSPSRNSDPSRPPAKEKRAKEESGLYGRLTSIGVNHSQAEWCIHHRTDRLIEMSIELFEKRRRETEIQKEGAYLFSLIRDLHAAPLDDPEDDSNVEGDPNAESRRRGSRRKGPSSSKPGKRSGDVQGLGDAIKAIFGIDDSEPERWSWEKTRRVMEENRLLDRMSDLSHWFEILDTETGRRFRPTKATKQLLELKDE